MSWLTNQKDKIVKKRRYKYIQMRTLVTSAEHLEGCIRIGLCLVLLISWSLVIHMQWFTMLGRYTAIVMIVFWLTTLNKIAHKLTQYWQYCSLKKATKIRINDSDLAEQRLLNILAISTDWQGLSPEDRNLKALRALDDIYRIAIDTSPVAASIKLPPITVTTDTPVSVSFDEVMPLTETSTKISKHDKG